MADDPLEPPERLATGVPGLDTITGGGLAPGSLYLIEGRAGAGKTLLSSQFAFFRAGQGERVLYASLIAESHGKLMQHLATMSFFRPGMVGRELQFVSAYAELREGGTDGLLVALARLLREHQPQVLLIDGFNSVRGVAKAPTDLPHFLHELNALVAAMRVVGLLLAPIVDDGLHPEHTLVDGLVELETRSQGMRTLREIEVRKMRGADHALGRHNFVIDGDGLRIYPRLEGIASRRTPVPPRLPGLTSSGVAGLDALMGGGIDEGSTTSLIGAPGSGKTLTGLCFLTQALRDGASALYFGFYESPTRLIDKAQGIGLDLQGPLEEQRLRIVWQPALEYSLDELATRLLDALGSRATNRVFVDGLDAFRDSAFYPERLPRFFTALTNMLRERGATTFFSEEVPLFRGGQDGLRLHYSGAFENILWLHSDSAREGGQEIQIVKVRDHAFEHGLRPLLIGPEGVQVGARPAEPHERRRRRP
jgi:circadian clock protein KaiC